MTNLFTGYTNGTMRPAHDIVLGVSACAAAAAVAQWHQHAHVSVHPPPPQRACCQGAWASLPYNRRTGGVEVEGAGGAPFPGARVRVFKNAAFEVVDDGGQLRRQCTGFVQFELTRPPAPAWQRVCDAALRLCGLPPAGWGARAQQGRGEVIPVDFETCRWVQFVKATRTDKHRRVVDDEVFSASGTFKRMGEWCVALPTDQLLPTALGAPVLPHQHSPACGRAGVCAPIGSTKRVRCAPPPPPARLAWRSWPARRIVSCNRATRRRLLACLVIQGTLM